MEDTSPLVENKSKAVLLVTNSEDDEKRFANDLRQRKKREKDISSLLDRVFGLQERMYTIRYDNDSLDEFKKEIELQNIGAEINHIESMLVTAITNSVDHFRKTLNLNDIDMDNIFPRENRTLYDSGAGSNYLRTPSNKVLSGKGFMRTPSTKDSLSGQPAPKKWHSLFKMYKEWKYQNNVADGQYVASRDSDLAQLDEEIAKLRAAIHQLRQRKRLTKQEERIFDDLKDQLRLRQEQKHRYAKEAFPGASPLVDRAEDLEELQEEKGVKMNSICITVCSALT